MTRYGLPLAQVATRTYYEATRVQTLDQWWHWPLLAAVALALTATAWRLYHRDGRELPRATRWSLLLLRLAAFAGLLLFFLQIEKRTEQKLTKNSRAILLVDTSQSMGLSDPGGESAANPAANPAGGGAADATRRVDQVLGLLGGPLLDSLSSQHDVVVYRFDQHERPTEVATVSRQSTVDDGGRQVDEQHRQQAAWNEARVMVSLAAAAAAVAVLALVAHLVLGIWARNSDGESWALLVGVVCCIVAGVFYSVSNLRHPEIGWQQVLLGRPIELGGIRHRITIGPGQITRPGRHRPAGPLLGDRGNETRLGDALQYLVDQERGGPVAGIAVFTDGNSNAGIDYRAAIAAGQQAEIPVHLISMARIAAPLTCGSSTSRRPSRVYPGDQFQVRGFIQAYGLSGRSAKVQLRSRDADAPGGDAAAQFEEEQIITLTADGEVTPVDFDVTPGQLGRRRYLVRIETTGEDLDPRDNEKSASVQVVDRQNRVLLLAGGPTCEYRFVRNLCYRDKDVALDRAAAGKPGGSRPGSRSGLGRVPLLARRDVRIRLRRGLRPRLGIDR